MKINKAKIRREAAQKIVKRFLASEDRNESIVFSSQRKYATELAQEILDTGINLSKSVYPFAWVGNMADMFLNEADKIIKNTK